MQAIKEISLPFRTFTPAVLPFSIARMDINEIRWQNFRALAGHHGGISEAAEKLNKTQGQVSHFGGKKPIKPIGSRIARQIETAYDKPHGWLDNVHEPEDELSDVRQIPSGVSGEDSVKAPILAQAENWIRFEERIYGPYQSVRRAQRLMILYRQIEADGGVLSPDNAEAIISAARNQGVGSGAIQGVPVGANRRKAR